MLSCLIGWMSTIVILQAGIHRTFSKFYTQMIVLSKQMFYETSCNNPGRHSLLEKELYPFSFDPSHAAWLNEDEYKYELSMFLYETLTIWNECQ